MSNSSSQAPDQQGGPKMCIPYNDQYETLYGYLPSLSAGIVFLVLFVVSTMMHLCQAARRRRFISILLAAATLTECISFSARIWSSKCAYNQTLFITQFITQTIAPSFVLTASYLVLRQLMQRLGRNCGFLSANIYFYLLFSSEILSLGLRCLGAGLTLTALTGESANTKTGVYVLLAGTIIHLISISCFFALGKAFLHKICRSFQLTKPEIMVVVATTASVLALTARGVYHVMEYTHGNLNSSLSTKEYIFLWLDAAMILIAVGLSNILDPARLLSDGFKRVDLRIYVEDTDSEDGNGVERKEMVYEGETFQIVELADHY